MDDPFLRCSMDGLCGFPKFCLCILKVARFHGLPERLDLIAHTSAVVSIPQASFLVLLEALDCVLMLGHF